MKTKSSLLMCLLTSGCLVSCTSLNKSAALNDSYQAKQNIKAITNTDLIKADRPDQYYEIGRHYQKNGNYSHAAIAYQKSLQLDPGYTKSITGLATVYADQKLYIISIPLFEQVAKLEPTAVNYNNLGYAYYLNKQYVEANRVLTQAIVLEPSYLQAQKNLELVTSNQAIAHSDSIEAVDASLKAKPINTESEDVAFNNQIESRSVSKLIGESQVAKEYSISNVEPNSETKVIQTASGIYELNVEHPAVITENTINTTTITPKDISVALSGGITFKQVSAISKLFDLADNSISPFNVSDSNKFVEIVNGNGVKGIARYVASKFNVANKVVPTKIADAERFNQMKTHIQYKTGYREDAVNLNHYLLNKPYLVRNDNLPGNVALRLVLGRDLLQRTSKS